MASITLHNVADDLLKRLELAAEARHHDLSQEIADRLNDSFASKRVAGRRTVEQLAALARQVRGENYAVGLTPEFIRMARDDGRE